VLWLFEKLLTNPFLATYFTQTMLGIFTQPCAVHPTFQPTRAATNATAMLSSQCLGDFIQFKNITNINKSQNGESHTRCIQVVQVCMFCNKDNILYIWNWICLCVSFFVPYAWPQFWVDLDQIWLVTSLYPSDGLGLFSEQRSHPQACAPCAVYIRCCKWVASSAEPFGTSSHQP